MSKRHGFKQIDVFTSIPFKGNPLAVIYDSDDLTDQQMLSIARWINLSETVFIVTPMDLRADYRIRIFSPSAEFTFAGHPTLGAAHALLESGLTVKQNDRLIQECGAGLIEIKRRADGLLSFNAPEMMECDLPSGIQLRLEKTLNSQVKLISVIAVGIRWLVVQLENADKCLAVDANLEYFKLLAQEYAIERIAMWGMEQNNPTFDYRVRALCLVNGRLYEDPVTGSANAVIAQQIRQYGLLTKSHCRARQGSSQIMIEIHDDSIWIGGQSVTVIEGCINLPLLG